MEEKRDVIMSYSAYSDWLDCPFKYYLGKIVRLKVEKDVVFTIPGSVLHKMIEEYFENGVPLDTKIALERAYQMEKDTNSNIHKAFRGRDKFESDIDRSVANINNFLLSIAGKPVLYEAWFGSWKEPLQVTDILKGQGAADLIVDNDNNTSILYDYKFTWSTKNLKVEQLLFYQVCYEIYKQKKIGMCAYFLLPKNDFSYYRFTEADKQRLIRNMENAVLEIQKGDFPKRFSPKCAYCDYRNHCKPEYEKPQPISQPTIVVEQVEL